MYILILIISLKSQFNHALDVRSISGIQSPGACKHMAESTITNLKSFNAEVEAKYSCEPDGTLIVK
jgi:hypothetical protein